MQLRPAYPRHRGGACARAGVLHLPVPDPGLAGEGVVPELPVVPGALMEDVEHSIEHRGGGCADPGVRDLLMPDRGLTVEGDVVPQLAIVPGALMEDVEDAIGADDRRGHAVHAG